MRLGSAEDDGDARNEFVTVGKQSAVSHPDKARGVHWSPRGLAGGARPGADRVPAPCPPQASSPRRQTQTRITTLNTSG